MPPPSPLQRALPLLGLGALWAVAGAQWWREWSANPFHEHAWLSLPMIALLAWREWSHRPAPAPGGSAWLLPLAVGLVALGPLRLVLEAQPDWRLPHALLGGAVLAATASALGRLGGMPWVRHFLPSMALVLALALPWPERWERLVIGALQRLLAGATVELLSLAGIPAMLRGSLIEVGPGTIGVDEACSGVRSLQAALLLAGFLARYARLTPLRTAILLLAGLGLAVLTNLVRSTWLSALAARGGAAPALAAHDPAGLLVLGVCLLGLCAVAWGLRKAEKMEDGKRQGADGQAGSGLASRTAGEGGPSSPVFHPLPSSIFHPLGPSSCCSLGLSLLSAALLSETATRAWYAWHERAAPPPVRWAARWPEEAPGFAGVEIPAAARELLRAQSASAARWRDPAVGVEVAAFFLEWPPGGAAPLLARMHSPEFCFGAIGGILRGTPGPVSLRTADGLSLPFDRYVFTEDAAPGSRALYVFRCVWEDGPGDATAAASPFEAAAPRARLEAVRAGRRNLGQRVLEISVRADSLAAASEVAARLVQGQVTAESPKL